MAGAAAGHAALHESKNPEEFLTLNKERLLSNNAIEVRAESVRWSEQSAAAVS
jgi:hypothetical protein